MNHTCDLYQFVVHVACGRGSVLLQRRCDTLCTSTSGFVDDIMFFDFPGLQKSTIIFGLDATILILPEQFYYRT